MINYQYTYFVGNLIVLGVWLFLFWWRKDVRKEMWIISVIFGFVGLFVEAVYVKDWWQPLTITKTPLGIEDFIFGFGIAGIAAVIYEEIFKKKLKIKKKTKKEQEKKKLSLIYVILLMAALFSILFYVLNLNSFIATIFTFIIPTLFIWFKRKDLIYGSIVTGIILSIMVIVGYFILDLLSPGFIEKFWLFQNIGHTIILGAPLEEIIWYFLAGALVGPLYEYYQEAKLVNVKKK